MVAYIQNFQRMSEASAAGGELHRRRIDGVYDEAINEMILGVTWTLTILTLLVVALRFFVRGQVFRKWYSDDWVMLFALVSTSPFTTSNPNTTRPKPDRKANHEQFAQLVYQIFTQFCCRATLEATIEADKTGAEKFTIDAAKWIIIAIVPSMVASVAGRVSGTILMCRIFASVRWFVWYMWIMTVVQVILGIFYILALYLAVFPLKALWDPSVPSHEIIPMRVSTAMNIPVGSKLFSLCLCIAHLFCSKVTVWLTGVICSIICCCRHHLRRLPRHHRLAPPDLTPPPRWSRLHHEPLHHSRRRQHCPDCCQCHPPPRPHQRESHLGHHRADRRHHDRLHSRYPPHHQDQPPNRRLRQEVALLLHWSQVQRVR